MGQREHSYTAGKNGSWHNTVENSLETSVDAEHTHITSSSNSTYNHVYQTEMHAHVQETS